MSTTEHTGGDAITERFLSIAQYILVIVFGLLPIFFLPLAPAPFAYSKVAIAVAGVFFALILYGFALLRSGTVRLQFLWAPALLWMLAFTALVSSLLSGDVRDALVGEGMEVHTTVFIALMALVASAWMMLGTNKAVIMRLFILLATSTIILSLFHIIRLLFGHDVILPSFFGASPTLSPFGGWNDLAIFFGLVIILSLVALEQLRLTTIGKALFGFVVAVALIMLSVINFFAVWVILGLVSLAILIYALTKDRLMSAQNTMRVTVSGISIGIAFVVLIMSVIFILGGSSAGASMGRMTGISYIEVRPSLQATADIARNVYADDALFGTGPNRFADAWRMHKDPAINTSIFWNTDFPAGFGYLPTLFVTTGLIGAVLVIAFLVMFVLTGLRMLLRTTSNDRVWYFIGLAAFVGGLYIWLMAIVYVTGPVLLLTAAVCTGLVGAAYGMLMPNAIREVNTRGNRRMGFVLVVSFLVFIIGSIAVLYFAGRHYVGAYVFNSSYQFLTAEGSLDSVEARVARAYELSRDDLYARRLAEYQVMRMQGLMSLPNPNEEQRQQFSNTFANGLNAAQVALAGDATNPGNWGVLANVYAMLVPANVEGAYDRTLEALTKARELDPHNPARPLALAQLAFANKRSDEARVKIEEALRLKSNYSDAIYALAQMDIADGNIASAIEAARAITLLEPQNPVRFFQLGLLQFSDQKWNDAIASFERAKGIDSQYANARYYLALTYDQLGRKDAARTELEAVLTLNQGNQLVIDGLARLDRGESLIVQETESAPVEEETPVETEDGSVTTEGESDTPLVSPVNTPTE